MIKLMIKKKNNKKTSCMSRCRTAFDMCTDVEIKNPWSFRWPQVSSLRRAQRGSFYSISPNGVTAFKGTEG